MKPTRKLNRRSFFAAVAGGVAVTGALGTIAADPAEAFQVTDSDSGPNSDPPGRGRGGGGGSCSDSDSGPNSDPGGRGRSCGRAAHRLHRQ